MTTKKCNRMKNVEQFPEPGRLWNFNCEDHPSSVQTECEVVDEFNPGIWNWKSLVDATCGDGAVGGDRFQSADASKTMAPLSRGDECQQFFTWQVLVYKVTVWWNPPRLKVFVFLRCQHKWLRNAPPCGSFSGHTLSRSPVLGWKFGHVHDDSDEPSSRLFVLGALLHFLPARRGYKS